MAATPNILGQADLSATTETDVYTVAASTYATVTVWVCNRNASARTFRIYFAKAGAATANKQYVAYDISISGNTAQDFGPFTLGPADVVRAYASATDLSVNVFGFEES
jgi:hypothetical protein